MQIVQIPGHVCDETICFFDVKTGWRHERPCDDRIYAPWGAWIILEVFFIDRPEHDVLDIEKACVSYDGGKHWVNINAEEWMLGLTN